MNIKSIIEYDRKSLERMRRYQLPHSFKKIGSGLFALLFIALFVNAFTVNNLDARTIIKYGLLISLLIISISKDEIEDERTTSLRMQSYTFAFIMGVFLALITPFADYLIDSVFKEGGGVLKDIGDFQILWILLFSQVFCFELFKRVNG